MPFLHDLHGGLLAHVLDFLSDVGVLELAVASSSLRGAVEECRLVGCGPWRLPPGPWYPCGIWRYLGLGDLTKLPKVTLCCETEFQETADVLAFVKAAKALAADTVDGQVVFNKCWFDAAKTARLFSPGDGEVVCFGNQVARIPFNGSQIECFINLHSYLPDGDFPWILVYVEPDNSQSQKPLVCCNSLVFPELRLLSLPDYETEKDHDLDATSPLTELVRANMPLPMFFGVKGLED